MDISKQQIVLQVDDACQSVAFYEALLGAPPTRKSATSAVFDFDSPPLILTVEERTLGGRTRARRVGARACFALLVTKPQHVGDAAIALRRAGIPLRLEDRGLEAHDPDGNAWRVRFVPSAQSRAVVAA
jgi:catechol-2,3-dioxygenase